MLETILEYIISLPMGLEAMACLCGFALVFSVGFMLWMFVGSWGRGSQ
jgi:hypothetical protein